MFSAPSIICVFQTISSCLEFPWVVCLLCGVFQSVLHFTASSLSSLPPPFLSLSRTSVKWGQPLACNAVSFSLFLLCSLTTFINTGLSKLTAHLSCFPLGHVRDMTVDLTFQGQASPLGCVRFFIGFTFCVSVCFTASRQSKNTAKQLCLLSFLI